MATEPNRTEPNRTEIIPDLNNNFNENNIIKLKQLFPEIFCENQIDFEKLKLILGADNLCEANERYQLGWAGKAAAYRALQSPTFNTLAPCQSESVDFARTQNVFIEAENMEALKILQKAYAGSVKMIYIDPPYNTGSDSFIYPDKFAETRDEYAQRVGDKDQDGYLKRDGVFQGVFRKNAKDNGHYHSNWLNMMLPRLHLAKTLLRDDGVIFISIDDNEQAQLKLLCDEVFGAENFVANLIVNAAPAGSQSANDFAQQHQYCMAYRKSDTFNIAKLALSNEELDKKYTEKDEFGQFYIERLWKRGIGGKREDVPSLHFPVYFDTKTQQIYIDEEIMQISDKSNIIKIIPYQTKGVLGRWTWSKSKMISERHKLKVAVIADEYKLHKKAYRDEDEGKKPVSIIEAKIGRTELGSLEIKNIFNGNKYFDYPKSSDFVKHFIKMQKETDALIMDFFSGSGTTAHAVMQLNAEDGGNRRYICVQLPEECDPKSEAAKAGFVTIAEIAKERIRRAGAQIRENHKNVDTGFKVLKLAESNFKQWRNPISGSLKDQLALFTDVIEPHATPENIAYELALRLGYQLTDNIDFSGSIVYLSQKNGSRLTALLLETFNADLLENVLAKQPLKIIALDKIFHGDDALKTNAALQCQDAGVAFETI